MAGLHRGAQPRFRMPSAQTVVRLGVAAFVIVGILATLIPLRISRQGMVLVALTGGSMSPTFRAGEVIKLRPTPHASAHPDVGDIVTFQSNKSLTTHRVVEIVHVPAEPEPLYRVKGDANDSPDPDLVSARSIVGVVDGGLSQAEAAAMWLQRPVQRLVLFGVPLLAVILGQASAAISWLRQLRMRKRVARDDDVIVDLRDRDLVGF